MTMDKILALIDSEIVRLKQVRAVLPGDVTKKTAIPSTPKKREMSAASRRKIADAQRKRWAR
jgi:hypothetical protein